MQTITHQKVRAHCLHHHRLKLTMKNVKVKNYAKKNAIDLLLTFTNSRMNLVICYKCWTVRQGRSV